MSNLFQSTTSTEKELTAPVFEGYGVEENGDLIAIAESYQDQLNVVKSIHALGNDITSFETTAATMESASDFEKENLENEYESVVEASVKDGWAAIKKFFSDLWGKLTAFFKSIGRFFDSMFRSSEGFVKQHESDLRKLVLDGFKFKMHKYTNLENPTKADKAENIKGIRDLYTATLGASNFNDAATVERLREASTKSKEHREEILDGVRGISVGKSALSVEQFKKELFAHYRNGAKSHDDREEISVSATDIIAVLKNESAKKNLAEFEKEVNSEFSNLIKRVDGAAKAVEAAGKANTYSGEGQLHKANIPSATGAESRAVHFTPANRGAILEGIRTFSSFVTGVKDIQLATFRGWKEAVTERERTYRSAAMAAFRYKKAS